MSILLGDMGEIAPMGGYYKFIAWCAKTPDLGDGPLDIDFADDDVHAAFADTAEKALNKLKSEVLN